MNYFYIIIKIIIIIFIIITIIIVIIIIVVVVVVVVVSFSQVVGSVLGVLALASGELLLLYIGCFFGDLLYIIIIIIIIIIFIVNQPIRVKYIEIVGCYCCF